MLPNFFNKETKPKLPDFVESVDDFPHLKLVKLRGNLDADAMGSIQDFIKKAKNKALFLDKSIILDLRKVDHVDTAAIAQLLKLFNDLKQKKLRLGIMNVPDTLKSMISILKLEDVVVIFDSKKLAFSEILSWSEDWK